MNEKPIPIKYKNDIFTLYTNVVFKKYHGSGKKK